MQPSEAKKSVVDVVDQSTAAVGGRWERASGPAVRECGQASGAPGTAYVSIVKRVDTEGSDADADVDALVKHWREAGIDVERFQSGGDNPVPGARGRGGPLISIGFDANPGNYRITAVSKCSDGDPDELRTEN